MRSCGFGRPPWGLPPRDHTHTHTPPRVAYGGLQGAAPRPHLDAKLRRRRERLEAEAREATAKAVRRTRRRSGENDAEANAKLKAPSHTPTGRRILSIQYRYSILYRYCIDTVTILYRYSIDTVLIQYRYCIDTVSIQYRSSIDTVSCFDTLE